MDKELALILSEMFIKHGETNIQVSNVTNQLQKTNSILKEFMGVSVKQRGQQQKFNEILIGEIKQIKEVVVYLV